MALRKSIRRAYTLVEILVVVTIIGMIGAIVVPHMLQAGTMQVQAAGRIVIADILYAQNDAVAQQRTRRVVFEPSLNRYRLTDIDGNLLTATWMPGQQYAQDFNADKRFTGVRMQNVNFNGGQILEYDELGTPLTGGSLDLVAAGKTYRVTVAPFTGRVTIDVVGE